MIHLFRKVYLVHEGLYHSEADSIALQSSQKAHPLARKLNLQVNPAPAFDEWLRTTHAGSSESFWKALLEQDSSKLFNVFVDGPLLVRLLIEFWKSIFPSAGPADLYRLFGFTVLDIRLKAFQVGGYPLFSLQEFNREVSYLPVEDFAQRLESAPVIECLRSADKGDFSFEFLLADHFGAPDSRYLSGFRRKLEMLSWKLWFGDVEILRSEILNALYDVSKLVPGLKLPFEGGMQIEAELLREPRLAWMLDDRFSEDHVDYVKARYPKEIFIELYDRMNGAWGLWDSSKRPDPAAAGSVHDILPTEYVYEGRYEEFLMTNIRKGFGCVFISDRLRLKANQLLPSFVYQKVREGRTAELAPYRLA